MNLHNMTFSWDNESKSNVKAPSNPHKSVRFYIFPYSILHKSPCMRYCSLYKVDYFDGHRISSNNICPGTVLTLHTPSLVWLGDATPLMTIGNMGTSRELCPPRGQSGSVALLSRAYSTRRLYWIHEINRILRPLWYQM